MLVAINASTDILKISNESAIIYGIVNNLILLIANDVGVKAEFIYHSNGSSSPDLAINFDEGKRSEGCGERKIQYRTDSHKNYAFLTIEYNN